MQTGIHQRRNIFVTGKGMHTLALRVQPHGGQRRRQLQADAVALPALSFVGCVPPLDDYSRHLNIYANDAYKNRPRISV